MVEGESTGDFLLVAIGASAGGLHALLPLLRGLDPGIGQAYVIVQHQAPDHDNMLVEILAKASPLPVVAASEGLAVAPGHVYVAPPGHDLEIRCGHFTLPDRLAGSLIGPSVDRFFRSYADGFGAKAIAVVLSGAGSDGTIGALAVKAAGGRVLAQLPEEALQPGMPRSVIASGCVDRIGSIGSIAVWLGTEVHSWEKRPEEHDSADVEAYVQLFRRVSEVSGIDLSRYKEATLHRQTRRRHLSLGIKTLPEYIQYVDAHGDEPLRLQQCFMISVSSFFRDPQAFAAVEQHLRELIGRKRPGDSIRLWVPGCATGEEVYSLAMLLAEILGDAIGHYAVRVIGSDIDEAALAHARTGFYSAAETAVLEPERRLRWLRREGDEWKVVHWLRELCVFALHDVTADPPFIKLDMVSCRNLLIYLTPKQQAELVQSFAYALGPGGLLLLGKSESVGIRDSGFEPIDGALKIFRRRSGSVDAILRLPRSSWPKPLSHMPMTSPSSSPSREDMVAAARHTLTEYAPPGVVLNGRFEPVHFFGHGQIFFSLPPGAVDFAVYSLCRPELASELKAMCYRLVQERLPSLEGLAVMVGTGEGVARVRPILRRIEPREQSVESGFLLILEEAGEARSADGAARESDGLQAVEVQRLRQELADTREQLHHVIENLEASNEELQSMQEELQASGEELQASNEELQASNEELTTLNDELRQKSHEATQLSVTLSNIQNSVRMSLVVLDREGHVLRFNDLATRIFGLVRTDFGQLIYGIPCQLTLPTLRELVERVVATGESHVEEVGRGEHHYLMRIDPYRDEDSAIAGTVLSFSDITELHRLEQARLASELRFGKVWQACLEGLLVSDREGTILLANPAAEAMFGYGPGEMSGIAIETLVPDGLRPGHAAMRQEFLGGSEQARNMAGRSDMFGRRRDASLFPAAISLSSFDLDGKRVALASVVDVTEIHRNRIALQQSEARLRTFVEALPLAAAMFDRDMRYVAASGRWLEDYRLGERDLIGRSHYEVFPEIGDEWKAVHQRALAGETISAAEDQFVRADKRVQWLHWEVLPWRSVSGEIGGILIVTEDVTARRLAGEQETRKIALEQELAVLQKVLDTSMVGYWDWNLGTGSKYLSATFKQMLGYAEDELPNTEESWRSLLFADDLEALLELLDRHVASRGSEPYSREVRYRHRDGSTVWVICSGLVVEWADEGRPVRMVGSHVDVTRLHEQLEALEEANRRAEDASRAKSNFLANMSHEIRTPLNAVLGLTHILGNRLDQAEHRAMVGKIGTAANHLLEVINDILDLSSIEAERFELHPKEFDLAEIGERLQIMLIDRARTKGLDFSVTCPGLGYLVWGDATRYLQAVLNLASNAVKYTPSGFVRICISRQAESEGRVLLLAEVEDSGPGVAPQMREHLFERFRRGGAVGAISGTGLGLSIVKRLAELMGGEAGLRSNADTGSTFWFTAWFEMRGPLSPAKLPADADPAKLLKLKHSGARILLVEDEPINQEIAATLLEDVGLVVDVVGDGVQGVAQAQARSDYRLIFMDMQMPHMDGLTATREIRRLPDWSGRPIVAMTANAFVGDRQRCLEAGMNDFVSKPIEPETLYETVLRWLAQPEAK